MTRIPTTAAAAAALAFLAAVPLPARAQWTVVCPTCRQELTDNLAWAQQAADMVRQLQQMKQQYDQLVMTYQAITRVTDLGSAVAALNMLGIRNPLPINPYAAQGLLNGTGGAGGMLNSLSGLYTGTLNGNTVYAPRDDTWTTRQIVANGGGLAGAQALALQLYQSAGERVAGLAELQARIDGAPDPSEREALIARLGVEQAYIQNQQVQAQNIQTYLIAQTQVREQQREERLQQSIDEILEEARGRGWWR
ncbi:MAG: type IV secretion system protein [Acetobacteraceae bacterium]|nr:type IV secretion system protein [Acetobacteraceae bacterium]